MSRICILKGSPRKEGNTNTLLGSFAAAMEKVGHICQQLDLHDMDLKPCVACRVCQAEQTAFGCAHHDDMEVIFDSIMRSDMIVLATPIYSWYCTPPMKMVLDRLVYGTVYFDDEKAQHAEEFAKELAAML